MTVNNDETYMTTYDDNGIDIDSISYEGEGLANTVLSEMSLSNWIEYTKENIWDCFTNYTDNKLKFLVLDQNIRNQILNNWSNIPYGIMGRVDSVNLVMGNENSTNASIVISFNDDGDYLEDSVININFDVKKPDTLPSDVWVNNENRKYPKAMTEWADTMETTFSAVFDQTLVSRMDEILPFPDFDTRTFTVLSNSFNVDSIIKFRDKNATVEDMDSYIRKLVNESGYERNYKEKDVLRYDLMIRNYKDIYYSYATFYIEYDNGVNMVLTKTYNEISYNGRNTVNSFLKNMNFLELEKDDTLSNFEAVDLTFAEIEGYSYLASYDRVLSVSIDFDDYDKAIDYMEKYSDDLVNMGYYKNPTSETNYHSFESDLVKNSFSYYIDSSTKQIYLIFRYTEYIDDITGKELIINMGLPEIDLESYESHCKDISKFYEIQYNLKHELVLDVDLTFESAAKKEAYLNAYAELLTNDSFEYYDNPLLVKVPYKAHAFYNREKRLIIAFNFDDSNMLSLHLIKVTADFEPLNS